ncbi:hypothetical protein Tco_1421847 [Tanacetum coccineum]
MKTTGVVIRDTPSVYVSKKKAPAKVDRGKGMDLLFDVALLEAARLKKVLMRSKKDTHMLHTSDSNEGTGTKLGVPDVPEVEYSNKDSEVESWGDSEDKSDDNDDENNKDHDDDSDDERTESDENKDFESDQQDAKKEEEGYSDERVQTPDYYVPTDEEEYNVKDDEYVKTEAPVQSSSISSNLATKYLNFDNIPTTYEEINSMMDITVCHEDPGTEIHSLLIAPVSVIFETSSVFTTTIPQQQSTQTPTPTTEATTSLPVIPDFSSQFGFNQRVYVLEKVLSQLKQVDHSAKLLEAIKSQVLAVVEAHLGTRLRNTIQWVLKEEVKFEREVSDFDTHVIQSTITESLEDVILAKSSSQPQSTYEAAASLTEFELKKILLDKMQKSQSYRGAKEHKELYDGLVKSYKLDKDLFESFGKAYSLKRGCEDKDKDEDPLAGSNQGLKRRKKSKDNEPSKDPKSKESKSSSSKGTKSHLKSSGKSAQAEESVFEVADTEMPQNQGSDLGNTSCNTTKLGRSRIISSGALLHRSIAQDMRTTSKRVV